MFDAASSFNQDISGWDVSKGQFFVSATESHVISYHLQDFYSIVLISLISLYLNINIIAINFIYLITNTFCTYSADY